MIVKMKKAKDFENLWFRYKTEGEPKNISINQFCMQNGVQFTQFNKWFRSTRQDVFLCLPGKLAWTLPNPQARRSPVTTVKEWHTTP